MPDSNRYRRCTRRPWMVLVALAAIVMTSGLPDRLHAQAPPDTGSPPAFDAVTVRQNNTNAGPRGLRWAAAGMLEVRGLTLRDMVRIAYDPSKYQMSQVVGGPEWLDVQRFDINAVGKVNLPQVAPGATAPPAIVLTMLRGVLETQFKLKAREDMREVDYFALTRARPDALGPQLKARESCRPPAPNVAPDAQTCNLVPASPGALTARAINMERLTGVLAAFPSIGKLVKDETQLEGIYDIDMTYVPDFINAFQAASRYRTRTWAPAPMSFRPSSSSSG